MLCVGFFIVSLRQLRHSPVNFQPNTENGRLNLEPENSFMSLSDIDSAVFASGQAHLTYSKVVSRSGIHLIGL